MSRKQIKIDQNFDKLLKDHINKDGRRTLCLSVRGSQVVISGEEVSVDLARENLDNLTVLELIQAMKGMEHEGGGLVYKSTERLEFPPMEVKFKGQLWTAQKARKQLNMYLNILGFGKTGTKKFTEPADEPAGWPEEHSFETFGHPSYANINVINDVIESLLDYHGFDAKTHTFITKEPEAPPPKKRKRTVAKNNKRTIETEEDLDPNDNSLTNEAHEGGETEEPTVSKPKRKKSNGEKRKDDVAIEVPNQIEPCAYEVWVDVENTGLMPDSEARKIWEESCTD